MSNFEELLEQRVRRYSMTADQPFDADEIAEMASGPGRRRWSMAATLGRTRSIGRPMLAGAWLVLVALVVVVVGGSFVVGSLHPPISTTPSPLPTATPHNPSPSATSSINGKIIYGPGINLGPIETDIVSVNADGTSSQVIATGACPRLSSDGTVLGFLTGMSHEGTGTLTVSKPDGSDPRIVATEPINDTSLTLSPDGAQALDLSGMNIVVGDSEPISDKALRLTSIADGTQRILVTHRQGSYDGAAAWSPDGRSIAFATYNGVPQAHPIGAIEVVDVASGAVTQLTPIDAVTGVTWSPDGSRIAYEVVDGDPAFGLTQTHFVAADGSGDRGVIEGAIPAGGLWSPDGSAVAFKANDRLGVALVVGTNVTNIKSGPTDVIGFAWSPDSSRLVFAQRGPEPSPSSASPGFAPTVIQTIDGALTEAPTKVGDISNVQPLSVCIDWASKGP